MRESPRSMSLKYGQTWHTHENGKKKGIKKQRTEKESCGTQTKNVLHFSRCGQGNQQQQQQQHRRRNLFIENNVNWFPHLADCVVASFSFLYFQKFG